MRKWLLGLVSLLFAVPLMAQTDAIQNYCTQGGSKAMTSGLGSTNALQGVINGCIVTVYLTGSQTKATIFSNASGGGLSNPFTANQPPTVNPGAWIFWATTGVGYDIVLSGGNGDPNCTTAPNCYTHPVTLVDVKVGGSGGGGGGNVLPTPQYTVGVYPLAGTQGTIGGGLLTTDSLGDFSVPANTAMGSACTSATQTPFPPVNCNIFNYTSPAPYGGIAWAFQDGIVLNNQETTPAPAGGFGGNFLGFEHYYKAAYGGAYTFGGSGNQKTNYVANLFANQHDTMGTFDAIYNYTYGFGGGDIINDYSQQFCFADYVSAGEETCVGKDVVVQQGFTNSSPGTGGIWKGTLGSINSGTGVVNYTPANNAGCVVAGDPSVFGDDCYAGAGRFIRDIATKYSTGTVTLNPSTDCGFFSTSRNECTLTGVGTNWTAWQSDFVGTHTTFGGTEEQAPIVGTDMCIAMDSGANDGYDFVMPVTQGVDATHLRVYLYPNGGWIAPLNNSTTYSLYRCAWPLQFNKVTHNFTAGGPNTTGMHSGDLFDQTLGYSWGASLTALEVAVGQHTGLNNFGVGAHIFNFSDSTAPAMNSALEINGNWVNGVTFLSGPMGNIVTSYVAPSGTFIRWNAPETGTLNFLQYNDDVNGVWPGISINESHASNTAGVNFMRQALVIRPDNQILMENGAMRSDGGGNFVADSSISTTIGGIGGIQNQAQDSQFQAGTLSTYWASSCAGTGAAITQNTTDVTDPFGNHTALKVISGSTQPCLPTNGAYLDITQNLSVATVAGHTYVLVAQLRSTVANSQVQLNVAGAWTGAVAPINLTTGWVNYPLQFVATSSGLKAIVFAFYTPSATYYLANVELADVTVGGDIYVQTNPTPVSPTLGQTMFGQILSSGSSVTSIIATSPLVASASTGAVITISCPSCPSSATGTTVQVNGGSTLGSLNLNGSTPSPDALFGAATFKISGANAIVEVPYGTNSAPGIVAADSSTTSASGGVISVLNAPTATALATAPTNCASANKLSQGIAASGNAICSADAVLTATSLALLGNAISMNESTPPSGSSGVEIFWADSTKHRYGVNPNNAGTFYIPLASGSATSGHCVQWGSNGIDLTDAGAACGSGGGSSAFSALTSGTNTTMAALIGTGASLGVTGSGTIAATSAPYSGLTGSVPTWNQNTTGTAANLSGTPALPNGTTATTQTTTDASTKLANDSFVQNVFNAGVSGTSGFYALFSGTNVIGNGHMEDAAGIVTLTEPLTITGAPQIATGTASNTDLTGQLTLSGGTATYSFVGTYTSGPICTASDTTAANAVRVQTSTTTLTLTGTSTDVLNYICVGRN